MAMCCNMCCPHPKMAVIRPIGQAGKIRKWVKGIVIGEVVNCILRMMIFDLMSGFMQAISVWIDFMCYSTMHWCQTIIFILSAGIDFGMLLFSWCKSDSYKAVINSHWLSRIAFWLMIAFYIVKLVTGITAFVVWKKEFKKLHHHTDCCRPVQPPAMADGLGGPGASYQNLHSSSDEESHRQGGGRAPLPFAGQGVQIGGDPVQGGWNQNPNLYAQPQDRRPAPAHGAS